MCSCRHFKRPNKWRCEYSDFPSSAIDYRTKDIRYPRNFNTPNNDAVAKKLATLEGTEKALLLSSGMAAIAIGIMALVKPGEHIVFQKISMVVH